MNNKLLIASIALAAQLMLQLPTQAAAEFPGQGDKKDWQKASRIYDQALAIRKKGDVDQAIKLYEEAIKVYPYDGDFYYNLSIHYSRDKKDYARAAETIDKAIELKPSNYQFQWQKAVILLAQANLDDAKKVLTDSNKLKKTKAQQTEFDSTMKKIDEQLNPKAK